MDPLAVCVYGADKSPAPSRYDTIRYGINVLVGGRPIPPEILRASDLPSPVNGILWEMSELITQERIDVQSSNLVEGLTT